LNQSPLFVRRLLCLSALALAALACQIAGNPAGALAITTPASSTPPATSPPTLPATATPTNPPRSTPTPAAPRCHVETGDPAGWLNLRSCAGLSCAAIAWLPEGAPVELLPTPAAGAWLAVWTGEVTGWAYSDYLSCEVQP